MRNHWVALSGVAIMAGAFMWSLFPSDSAVPNDANIGAGVLFVFGGAVVIAGLAMAWARRSSTTSPPPPNGPVD